MNDKAIRGWKSAPLHVVAVVFGLIIVVPVVFGVLGGFKDNGQLFTNPFGLPSPWVPSNSPTSS